jgi:hypothetical protein
MALDQECKQHPFVPLFTLAPAMLCAVGFEFGQAQGLVRSSTRRLPDHDALVVVWPGRRQTGDRTGA